VVLDFSGIIEIGQAFADEIFRVYKNANTQVQLRWVGATEDVASMIDRALNAKNDKL
jgi:hypothetical protein